MTIEAIYLVLDDLIVTNPVSVRRQSIQRVADSGHFVEGSTLKHKTPAGIDWGHGARGTPLYLRCLVFGLLLFSVRLGSVIQNAWASLAPSQFY